MAREDEAGTQGFTNVNLVTIAKCVLVSRLVSEERSRFTGILSLNASNQSHECI